MHGQSQQMSSKLLCILVLLTCSCTLAQYPASSPFSKSVCIPIPTNLKLCRDMEYTNMTLPNLLNHETMEEIHQQARSWVPLLPKRCHPDLQLFLCSLFTPVCVPDAPGPIYPCRSLCEPVRDACAPVMERAGYPWPSMLSCDKYPQNDMCINVQCKSNCSSETSEDRSGTPPICSPCDNPLDKETVLDHFCASEFALKVRIRAVKVSRKDLKIYTDKRKRVVYKQGPLRKKELRRLILFVQDGAKCPCPQLRNTGRENEGKKKKKEFYFIMGRKLDRKLLVTVLHHWPKRQKALKRLSKKFADASCSKK